MKWGTLHPAQETYDFTAGDGLVSFAQAHAMQVRGHNLLWYLFNPKWLTNGSFSSLQLHDILKDHITTIAKHFAGQVYAWDVVNEALNDDGTVRSSIWSDSPGIGLSGTSYIEQAFRWARAADSQALLFYNDYSEEASNAKSDAMYNMVRDFRSRGVPIDGVGLQMHITPDPGFILASLDANIKRFEDLGVQVHITEMDVRLPVDSNGVATQADLSAQAQTYHDVAAICLQHPFCTSIQTWGFTDKYSWIPGFFTGFGAALPFDTAYQPKAAYNSLRNALTQAAPLPLFAAEGAVNAASFLPGAVSPGEIITVFGKRFGPAVLAHLRIDANGLVDSVSGDTRVLFDGAAAPMIFSISGQLAAVVPYAVAGKSFTAVQVEYKGVRSPPVVVDVVPSAPGIFTADSSGKGQGAVLNHDLSPNSAANPEHLGGVVVIYATGEGQTKPPGMDGKLANGPPPTPSLGVTVKIGGITAGVQYAGGAPTLVAGVLQVNATIPRNAPVGDAVPVELTVGTASSAAPVTIAIAP